MENLDIALFIGSTPQSDEIAMKAWLEGRDYVNSVTYEDMDDVTQEQLNAYDLVANCRSSGSGGDHQKLKGLTVPVFFRNELLRDYLKFGTGNDYASAQTQINITSNSHYITQVFELGNLTIQSSDYLLYITGWSQDVTPLAKVVGQPTQAMILYLDKDDLHIDETVCTERMVFFGTFNIDSMLENGATLFDRIITWLMHEDAVEQVATPEFAPDGGTYSEAQNVTITCATGGATIKYTTDGSEPSQENGTEYSEPVSLTENTVLKAIAYKAGMSDSEIKVGNYYFKAVTPTFDPIAGKYYEVQNVVIATTTDGATIKYTTDGSAPSPTNGTEYTEPVEVAVNLTLKAIAYKANWSNSEIKSGAYIIELTFFGEEIELDSPICLEIEFDSPITKEIEFDSPICLEVHLDSPIWRKK